MSTNDRIKLPPLERTDPVRNWSTLLNAASSAASTGEPASNGGQASGLGDVISRSVAIGYQVVEEYVRQGERAARRMTAKSSPTGATADARELVQRMGHYASELFGMWLELAQRTTMASSPRVTVPRLRGGPRRHRRRHRFGPHECRLDVRCTARRGGDRPSPKRHPLASSCTPSAPATLGSRVSTTSKSVPEKPTMAPLFRSEFLAVIRPGRTKA